MNKLPYSSLFLGGLVAYFLLKDFFIMDKKYFIMKVGSGAQQYFYDGNNGWVKYPEKAKAYNPDFKNEDGTYDELPTGEPVFVALAYFPTQGNCSVESLAQLHAVPLPKKVTKTTPNKTTKRTTKRKTVSTKK